MTTDRSFNDLVYELQKAAVNDLHRIIMIAQIAHQYYLALNGDYPNQAIGHLWLAPVPDFKRVYRKNDHLHKTIEQAGVAGMYGYLRKKGCYELVFGNDWYVPQGYDALVYNKETREYFICESKGTTNKTGSPAGYLKQTRHKGRQLSWEWCWKGCVEFAFNGATANVFLNFFPLLLEQERVKRYLFITRVKQQRGGFVPQEVACVEEEELCRYAWLNDEYQLPQTKKMYQELIKRGLITSALP